MSRFVGKLRQVSQAGSQPIGFRAGTVSTKPKILLIASLDQANLDRLADWAAGADAGVAFYGVHCTADAVGDAGRAGQRLCADGPGEGTFAAAGDLEARSEECVSAGAEFFGSGDGGGADGVVRGGVDLRHTGSGEALCGQRA